jgi:hypothetical protein
MEIERYSVPTKYDTMPYGTCCKVKDHHNDSFDLYLQVNRHEEEDPVWEFLVKTTNTTPQFFIDNMIIDRLQL